MRSFRRYLDKVFGFQGLVERIRDGRPRPQIPAERIFFAFLWGSLFRMRSVHKIEADCRLGNLGKLCRTMSEDAIRYGLARVELWSLQELWYAVAKRMKRVGMLVSSVAGGRLVGAVDGIELYRSYARCCPYCLERQVEVTEQGKKVRRVQYYHRAVVLSLVCLSFPIPLGVEVMRPGEDELQCAIRLLDRMVKALGKAFFQILVADALYPRSTLLPKLARWGKQWVFTLKENQADLLREAVALTRLREPARIQEGLGALWDHPTLLWTAADRDVRVIRAVETKTISRIRGGNKIPQRLEAENVWLTDLSPRAVSAESIYTIGHHRWQIDTALFGELTQHWFLKHTPIHQVQVDKHPHLSITAFQGVLHIRLIAYLLFHLYLHRQVLWRKNCQGVPLFFLAHLLYLSIEDEGVDKKTRDYPQALDTS